MEFDAPSPGCPNPQIIHEFDFKTLFEPPETTLESESRSRQSLSIVAPISQNVSGPTPAFPPFESEPIQPSHVEGQNGLPSLESNVEGFQDATNQFVEFDPIPDNNGDNANFLDFPNENDVDISISEVQGEHHPQIQVV